MAAVRPIVQTLVPHDQNSARARAALPLVASAGHGQNCGSAVGLEERTVGFDLLAADPVPYLARLRERLEERRMLCRTV